jgi:hypothetical protein
VNEPEPCKALKEVFCVLVVVRRVAFSIFRVPKPEIFPILEVEAKLKVPLWTFTEPEKPLVFPEIVTVPPADVLNVPLPDKVPAKTTDVAEETPPPLDSTVIWLFTVLLAVMIPPPLNCIVPFPILLAPEKMIFPLRTLYRPEKDVLFPERVKIELPV